MFKFFKKKDKKYRGYPAVRELTLKDRKKFSALIKEYVNRSGNETLIEMVPSLKGGKEGKSDKGKSAEPTSEEMYDLIKNVLTSLVQFLEEEVTLWFMDVTGTTSKEDFEKLPFDIEVYIIRQLMAQEGFNNFFTQASALFKKIQG